MNFEQVHAYAFNLMPDPEAGEGFGYYHRDGRRSSDLKGNHWKGPFHIPRMLLYGWKLLSPSASHQDSVPPLDRSLQRVSARRIASKLMQLLDQRFMTMYSVLIETPEQKFGGTFWVSEVNFRFFPTKPIREISGRLFLCLDTGN